MSCATLASSSSTLVVEEVGAFLGELGWFIVFTYPIIGSGLAVVSRIASSLVFSSRKD